MQTTFVFPVRRWGLFFCSLVLAHTLAQRLQAAPFAENLEFTQPDGTTVTLWGEGDEFHAVFESQDGFTVVFDPAQRAYCYATLSADGTALLSTGAQVHQATGASLGLAQHLRITSEAVRLNAAERRARWEAGMEISSRWPALKAASRVPPADGPAFAPPSSTTTGNKTGLCLLIDFEDDPATIPQADIVNFLNGDNYTSFSNNGSVKKYFQDVSNGLLTYTNVVTIYIRIPNSLHPKSYYNDTTKDAGDQANLLIRDALNILKALPDYDTTILPTFDALTTDSQNRVIACNVFYAGGNGGVWSMGLWPHSWSLYNVGAQELSAGGKKVYRYQITNIGSSLKIGTFCHENGHMLCGYPDLYDYDYDSIGGAGNFCLMGYGGSDPGNPTQICAYLKRASGWATTTELTSASNFVATVTATPGPQFNHFYRYKKPGSNTEYYLIECRYKTNHDATLPASGVAVWHIDELGDRDNQSLTPNNSHANYECTLVQADNKWDFQKNKNAGDNFDLYHSGNTAAGYNNTLSDSSAPHARWWNGANSGMNLNHFSARSPVMTFVVGDPTPVFTNQPPGSLTVELGADVQLSAGVKGLPPLRYQWLKDGAALAGATTPLYQITSAKLSDAGTYSLRVTNDYASAESVGTVLVVIVPLPEALDATNLTWTTGGNRPWQGELTVTYDTVDAAESGPIGNNQHSALQTTVPGPGTLSFWWKVSSEADADFLRFAVEGVDQAAISGEVDWHQLSFHIPPGYQTLEWIYSKNATGAAGADKGWLDLVTFIPTPMPPNILRQPDGTAVLRGMPATFSVSAEGSPPLTYQWQHNGTNIPGATDSTLTLLAQDTSVGRYNVRVANAHGAILSSNALLALSLLGTAGDNSFGQSSVSPEACNIVALAAGDWHSLALRRDGKVVAWGNNWDGQCNVPQNLGQVVSIAAGGYHSLAVQADGSVVAWGANSDGQIAVPAHLRAVLAVAAGTWHSLALREDGTVVAWGDNSVGQSSIPTGLNNVVAIAAGGNHSLALRRDGTVAAWGENTDAHGAWVGQSVVPAGLTGVVAIAAGAHHSLAVKADGTVVGWGDNAQGQAQVPPGLTNVVGVAAGGQHSLALQRDGTVVAWGDNTSGQCTLPLTQSITAIAAGGYHTEVLLDDGLRSVLMFRPGKRGSAFGALIQTQMRGRYALEFSDGLTDAAWTALSAVNGNGALILLTDPTPNAARRFYRVRQF